jgi:hypothetical protein
MNNLDTFLKSLASEYQDGGLTGDLLTAAKDIACTVGDFLTSNSIGVTKEDTGVFRINSSFDEPKFDAIGFGAIKQLIEAAKVPQAFRAQAAASVAVILHKAASAGKDFSDHALLQTKRAENNGSRSLISVEDLLPSGMQNSFVTSSMEAFGATSDKVLADLQIAVTVSLLKWHNTLTPRILQNIPTTEPAVSYIREEIKVYNLDDDVESDKSVIDLYQDPTIVTNKLTRIEPLLANKVGSEVVADNVLAFGKEAMLLKLGINANVYGTDKINRTDIVADGVKMESVVISIAYDGGTAEEFTILIPESRARLTRSGNNVSTLRVANISHTAVLDVASKNDLGVVSTVMTSILGTTGDKLVIKLEASPRIDIRNGATFALGSVAFSAINSANVALTTGTTVGKLADTAVTLGGYTLDARYNEENNRKSNIATTTERTQLTYEIPQGRNFVLDVPHNGPTVDRTRNVANIHNVIRIGQDNVSLQMVNTVLEEVGLLAAAYAADPKASNRPGSKYAAGGRVRPTFVSATLDMAPVDSFDDSRRQDAIEGRTLTFLTAIISEMMTKSFYMRQLDGSVAPTFRVITSVDVLSNVLGARPGTSQIDASNGVELALKLSSGVVLEIVTTTFSSVADKIIIIPYVASDPNSDLNFGHNRDYGTIVGSYPYSDGGAAVHRLLANVRELPIPTNAIGAIIDVTGIPTAVYRA